ncbi:ribosomal RNA-processing protein 7 homolog A [Dermacentor albipictus]|uniref:ribosomal RNA-processing protein 7 homolog A n=1 Tax=Dermacentor albipictus TaxID=60249 RepID=UPI0031FD0590
MAASNKDAFRKMPVKFSNDSRSAHVMLFKEHSVREKSEHKPSGRTLFVVNVPPYCDENSLKRVFGDSGKVAKVWLQKSPSSGKPAENTSSVFPSVPPVTGFKVAYVVFHKEASIRRALALSVSEPRVLFHEDCDNAVGMAKWCAEYKSTFMDAEEVQKEVDTYMADYDARLEEEKQRAKAMDGVPDDEGWITVTKYGKRPVIPRTDAVNQKISNAETKKRSQKELVNFYSFQIRESKMERIAQLRKKFEEDKRKISLMKASRRFKPV